jgi:hypothetical protein
MGSSVGLFIARLVVKVSAVLFVIICVVFFLKADSWLADRAKITGIILVALLIVMIVSLVTAFWIAGLYN